jgi:hypothetical protein
MNEILLQALLARIKAGQMTIEQVPLPYREQVLAALNQEGEG